MKKPLKALRQQKNHLCSLPLFALLLAISMAWVTADRLLNFIGPHSPTATVTVPPLTGKIFTDGKMVDDPRFRVAVTYVYHPDAPPRTILSQDPPPNARRKIACGKSQVPLELVVSLGEHEITVPDVTGMNRRQAALTLTAHHLMTVTSPVTLWETDPVPFTAPHPPAHAVLSTFPVAGTTVRAGDTVTIYVAQPVGDHGVCCPDVTGLSCEEAVSCLRRIGLSVGNITENFLTDHNMSLNDPWGIRTDSTKGTVIAQDKVAGTWLPRHTVVSLVIYPRPNTQNTEKIKERAWNTDKTASSSRSRAGFTPFGWTRETTPWRDASWNAARGETSAMKD